MMFKISSDNFCNILENYGMRMSTTTAILHYFHSHSQKLMFTWSTTVATTTTTKYGSSKLRPNQVWVRQNYGTKSAVLIIQGLLTLSLSVELFGELEQGFISFRAQIYQQLEANNCGLTTMEVSTQFILTKD